MGKRALPSNRFDIDIPAGRTCGASSQRPAEPIVARVMRVLEYIAMTKRLIVTVSLILSGLLVVAGLASASTERRHALPRHLADHCAYRDASGRCSAAMTQTIERAPRNSWTKARHPKVPTTNPAFKRRELYSAVRERLLKFGWQPASTADADRCIQGDSRCEGRPEMQACAGTGEANCNFRWRKADIVIDVSTINDIPVVTTISKCRNDCR